MPHDKNYPPYLRPEVAADPMRSVKHVGATVKRERVGSPSASSAPSNSTYRGSRQRQRKS